MRQFLATLVFATAFCFTRAATDSLEAQIRTADAARVRATLQADIPKLDPLLSAALVYGHADGRVQDKADYLQAVAAQRLRYEGYDYEEMKITPLSVDIATMTGRVRLRVSLDSKTASMRIRFLAVWRREDDAWRLFAYQSSLADASAK
jgi:ketosteroid isomerase-like protein